MTAATVATAAGLPALFPDGGQAKSRSQRQRAQSFEAGFVVHLDWLSDEDRARAARIIQANKTGWPAEMDAVFHQYGERLAPLSPDELRALYGQARHDVSGASEKSDDYLKRAWLPYKAAKGPAYATGHAGDGRGAHAFVALIAALRGHCFRNFTQRSGDGKWLRHEWFEDQGSLGREICHRRETVNRLLKDPDMDAWVVKVPRRWYDCHVSGGASRVASYRYLVACEDPLIPAHVAPIQARLRDLIDARLANLEEEAKEARAPQSADGDQDSRDRAERALVVFGSALTQNAVTNSHTQHSEEISQQSLPSERTSSEREVRRSAHEEESHASSGRRSTSPTHDPLATRNAQRKGATPNIGQTAQQATGEPGNEHPSIETNRTSNLRNMPRATAELTDDTPGLSAPRPTVGSAAGGTNATRRRAGGGHVTDAVTSDGGAPVGVDLAGDALLSEEGLRMAQTNHVVWNLACNLALDAEELDQHASGKTPEEMRASAKSFASHIVGLLAASSAPYDAMADFVYWVKRRAYRSALRDKRTGARVPWKKPGAYWIRTATGLAGEAERAAWDCAAKDAEEELVNRLNAEAAAWERRQEEERQRQAGHETERMRWAQRAADYQSAENHREEIQSTGGRVPDQDPDDEFGAWQRQQEHRERERLSHSGQRAEWVERLSKDEALAFLHRAMSDSVEDPQAVYRDQQHSRRQRPNPPNPPEVTEPSKPGRRAGRGGRGR